MNKQHKSVAEVFEETKKKLDGSAVEEHQKWVEYTPDDDQKNIAELEQMNKRLYEIAQEYGSNSQENYNILTAYDRIHDGAEEIKRKITDGTYAKAGVLQHESKIKQDATVEVHDAGRNKATADKIQRIMKEMDKLDDKVIELYNQIESAVWNEFDPATMDSQDPRQSLIAAWKISGVPSLDETLADWRNIF